MSLLVALDHLIKRQDLATELCESCLAELLDERTAPEKIAAFLVLLRAKKESLAELTAIVKFFRRQMITVATDAPVLDIVGTGGDGAHTVNISTGSAILAASCGVKIAKHGNHAVSSQAGSADVLTALGININLSAEQVSACIKEIGIGFCYSPLFHPAFAKLRTLRKQLGVATTFNILGPLLNPALATHFILGTLNEDLLPTMAAVLQQTGCARSIVVHGNGLDEMSCVGQIKMLEITPDEIVTKVLDPREFGFSYCSISDLTGGDAQHNAQLLLDTFSGKSGPLADTLILNAALALYLYGQQSSIHSAIAVAREQLHNQAALRLLTEWRAFSHDYASR